LVAARKLANVVPNEINYNSVVDALATQGNADSAEHWLQQGSWPMLFPMKSATTLSLMRFHSSVVAAHTRRSNAEGAEHWLQHMKLANVVPNEINYNSVVDALAEQGNADSAEHWLQQ
jgi:hypothetical protein